MVIVFLISLIALYIFYKCRHRRTIVAIQLVEDNPFSHSSNEGRSLILEKKIDKLHLRRRESVHHSVPVK